MYKRETKWQKGKRRATKTQYKWKKKNYEEQKSVK